VLSWTLFREPAEIHPARQRQRDVRVFRGVKVAQGDLKGTLGVAEEIVEIFGLDGFSVDVREDVVVRLRP
jgi:hypothetical protein